MERAMQITLNFGHWTTTKAALAIAGALTIGGAVGSAVAISPTIAPPITWAGGWEVSIPGAAEGGIPVYTVPPGRNLLVSDLMVGNNSSAVATIALYSSISPTCAGIEKVRLVALPVPPFETVNV